VSKFSKVAAEAAIKALHATLGGPSTKTVLPTVLEAVTPLLLMRPVRDGETLDLYAGGDFSLGDRVAMVGDGGSPSFGTRGYVVAVHGEACEILFDHEFVGGNDLHGVLPDKRGAMLPSSQLVNLSHPPAMPKLGDAAPDRVVADKKGKVSAGGWDPKAKGTLGSTNLTGISIPKGILAMAASLLPGKAGLPGGPGGTPSMPVPGKVSIFHPPHSAFLIAHTRLKFILLQSGVRGRRGPRPRVGGEHFFGRPPSVRPHSGQTVTRRDCRVGTWD